MAQWQQPPPYAVPSDISLRAAIYGTAHGDTVIAMDKIDRLLIELRRKYGELMAHIDLDVATDVLDTVPDAVIAPLPDPETAEFNPGWEVSTANLMAQALHYRMGIQLVEEWRASIDKRGRRYGAVEHGVRLHMSGKADDLMRAAGDRWDYVR